LRGLVGLKRLKGLRGLVGLIGEGTSGQGEMGTRRESKCKCQNAKVKIINTKLKTPFLSH